MRQLLNIISNVILYQILELTKYFNIIIPFLISELTTSYGFSYSIVKDSNADLTVGN